MVAGLQQAMKRKETNARTNYSVLFSKRPGRLNHEPVLAWAGRETEVREEITN